ncbi:hypothetical protein ACTPEF_26660, partial [Clostridioides difficile]
EVQLDRVINFESEKDPLEINDAKWSERVRFKSTLDFVKLIDDGDLYKGEFVDGKKNGFGIYIFSSKEKYEGLWKDDKMHGIGK